MHNEQILPLFYGSSFCADEGSAHGQRCGSGRSRALWSWVHRRFLSWTQQSVVVLGASKRYGCPSRGGASVSLLGSELGKCGSPPFAWRRKRCGSSSAVASIMGLIRRCEPLGPIWGCKCCGSSFIGVLALWFVLYVGLQVPCSSFMLRYQRRGSFFAWECQSGNESYRAGKAITNTAPPSGALNAVTVPSKLSTISFTMAKPRPAPPLLRAREASLR